MITKGHAESELALKYLRMMGKPYAQPKYIFPTVKTESRNICVYHTIVICDKTITVTKNHVKNLMSSVQVTILAMIGWYSGL